MTQRQSNKWSGGIGAHPAPKNSEFKNPLEIFRLEFLESRRHPPHWLSSKGPNYQRAVLLISAGAIEMVFWRKNAAGESPRCLVLARQCPGSPGTCNPEESGLPGFPIPWSPTLFSGSGPIGLPPALWTEKTIERSSLFVQRRSHCCRGDLVGRTFFWFFFWVAFKSESKRLRSISNFVGSTLNKSRVWSL